MRNVSLSDSPQRLAEPLGELPVSGILSYPAGRDETVVADVLVELPCEEYAREFEKWVVDGAGLMEGRSWREELADHYRKQGEA